MLYSLTTVDGLSETFFPSSFFPPLTCTFCFLPALLATCPQCPIAKNNEQLSNINSNFPTPITLVYYFQIHFHSAHGKNLFSIILNQWPPVLFPIETTFFLIIHDPELDYLHFSEHSVLSHTLTRMVL